MKNRRKSEFVGILLVGLGIVLALSGIFGMINLLLFKGWWTLFIILPFGSSIIKNGLTKKNGIGVLVGVLLFINARTGFLGALFGRLVFPLILVAIGVRFLTKGKIGKCQNDLRSCD